MVVWILGTSNGAAVFGSALVIGLVIIAVMWITSYYDAKRFGGKQQ